MEKNAKLNSYINLVDTKYKVYNSLFMNLPYEKVANIGMLIPLLQKVCASGLEKGKNPKNIIDQFFENHTDISNEEEKLDFFFRVIQYIERQVVLFDSIEDARIIELAKADKASPLKKYIQKLNGKSASEAIKKLNDFGTRIVFTAHPTQFYPLSVLDIINNLRSQILNNNLTEIDISLQQLGMTSFLNDHKPTPFQEAKNIIYYLRHVYYDAVGEIFENVKEIVPEDQSFNNYEIIKIGFWPGGDRDGNPFVTAEITRDVANELRTNLFKCYYNELKGLKSKLTFRKVKPIYDELLKQLYQCMFDTDARFGYKEIINRLEKIQTLIVEDYNGLYVNLIDRFIDKVHIFKTHFATLDIRQDSSIHNKVVKSILVKNGLYKTPLENLSTEDLAEMIDNPIPKIQAIDYEDPIVIDTIKNITNLKDIQEKNGKEGCDRYIISNSESIQDILFVYLLFRWCGYKKEDIHFDIIPLFETMVGMQNSESVMNELFSLPFYKEHLKKRDSKQTIMLGFSDGTKDGGYLKANWSIHNTKETLSEVCNRHNIKPVFFDGRGGPPARGGGKTHKFYASQSKKIANNEIQLTIQGQTITSTYGTQEAFINNVEQMLTAGLTQHLSNVKEDAKMSEQNLLMDELASISFSKYSDLKNHPQFIPYLENMSTLKYYSNANIGSRPGKRGNKSKLTLNDLRAISFVGSWSQLKQNVPGYFGIGTALKTLKAQGRISEITSLFNEMPFFKALILNSMMSLSKSYFPLTAYMKNYDTYKEFWQILFDEYELSKQMLLEISGYETLMEEEPISKRSISTREEIVLPLLTIQQYALQVISQGHAHEDVYKKIVTRSLYGNINASRNSA
jgi:phosphoenolpyruvate carboxylase